MKFLKDLAVIIIVSVCFGAAIAHADNMMKAEFRTMAECLSAIKSNSGQNLEVITDKTHEVSGFLSNGKGFGCSRKESGTKGVYFEGWFMVD
ncbi:MAG: hypothetical protein KJN72_07695 [Woeseia sp.]|nr:hypothetical protein [Woeseia sp.]